MKDLNTIKTFCSKASLYKKIETESEQGSKYQRGAFLCIRLDGIGLSKKYLKDKLLNAEFDKVIKKSVYEIYHSLKSKAPTDAKNQFLCIFTSSDEVNIILNSHPNYFDNRLYKSVTTIASSFSGFFTKNGKNNDFLGAFDGRPLILNSIPDICDYLSHRYAIYIRNTTVKLLRLNVNPSDLYESNNQNDLDYLNRGIKQNNLQKIQLTIPKHCHIYIPTENAKLQECKYDSINAFTSKIENEMNIFNNWLNKKNT